MSKCVCVCVESTCLCASKLQRSYRTIVLKCSSSDRKAKENHKLSTSLIIIDSP